MFSSETENFKSRILYGKSIKIEFKLCYDLWEACEYHRNCYFTENLPPTSAMVSFPTTIIKIFSETTIIATIIETTELIILTTEIDNKNNSICLSNYNSEDLISLHLI